jgi:hypothetical protein
LPPISYGGEVKFMAMGVIMLLYQLYTEKVSGSDNFLLGNGEDFLLGDGTNFLLGGSSGG